MRTCAWCTDDSVEDELFVCSWWLASTSVSIVDLFTSFVWSNLRTALLSFSLSDELHVCVCVQKVQRHKRYKKAVNKKNRNFVVECVCNLYQGRRLLVDALRSVSASIAMPSREVTFQNAPWRPCLRRWQTIPVYFILFDIFEHSLDTTALWIALQNVAWCSDFSLLAELCSRPSFSLNVTACFCTAYVIHHLWIKTKFLWKQRCTSLSHKRTPERLSEKWEL